jgi:hypothetical protein
MINDGEDRRGRRRRVGVRLVADEGHDRMAPVRFPAAKSVSEVQVYWFDDTGRGEVRVPRRGVCYKDGDQWKPVQARAAASRSQAQRPRFAP